MKTQLITSDPEILNGTPVFAGTRVPVKNLTDCLEAGDSIGDFLESGRSHAKAAKDLISLQPRSALRPWRPSREAHSFSFACFAGQLSGSEISDDQRRLAVKTDRNWIVGMKTSRLDCRRSTGNSLKNQDLTETEKGVGETEKGVGLRILISVLTMTLAKAPNATAIRFGNA